jgi:hypothetical protein
MSGTMNVVEVTVLVAAVLVGVAGIGLILLAVVGVERPWSWDAERRRPRGR